MQPLPFSTDTLQDTASIHNPLQARVGGGGLTAQRSLQFGVLAALLWSAADMLLVGFIGRPANYPLFAETLQGQLNTDLALLMLDGSPERLFWGVVLATFSVVF